VRRGLWRELVGDLKLVDCKNQQQQTRNNLPIRPPIHPSRSYQSSASTTPLIFALSPGSDPMTALLKFAETMRVRGWGLVGLGLWLGFVAGVVGGYV